MVDEPSFWRLANGRAIRLDRPRLMAILNITPDSFYAGSRAPGPEEAVAAAERAAAEGADVLDIGGESTRPGALRVPAEEQVRRVVPVIGAIRRRGGAAGSIAISVDTTLSAVARAALDAGADAVNDVSAGAEDPALLDVAARHGAGMILMHRLRPPEQDAYSDRYERPPEYGDVVATVRGFLGRRVGAALERGCVRESILVDPGLGFGKTVEQNLELIRRTGELRRLPTGAEGREEAYAVLSALSRKSFVGRASGLDGSTPADRLAGTIALSLAHRLSGAAVFRVHDVAAHAQAMSAFAAARSAGIGGPGGLDRRGPGG